MAGDDRGPRTVDPEAARRLRALFATSKPVVYRRPWWLLVPLLLIPALFIASQPLAWHHDIIPGHGYRVVFGYTRSFWVLVIGAVAVGVFVRVAQRPLTAYVVVLLLSLGGVTMIGTYSDWANSYTQAGALGLPPYNGPRILCRARGAGRRPHRSHRCLVPARDDVTGHEATMALGRPRRLSPAHSSPALSRVPPTGPALEAVTSK